MRLRVRRYFFTTISAASLLLFLMMSFLMMPPDWSENKVHFLGDSGWHHRWFIEFDGGRVWLCHWPTYLYFVRKGTWAIAHATAAGFAIWAWALRLPRSRPEQRTQRGTPLAENGFTTPILISVLVFLFGLWLYDLQVIVFLIGIPAFLIAGVLRIPKMIAENKRNRRLESGLCPRCGYDLRALPDRCPECGS